MGHTRADSAHSSGPARSGCRCGGPRVLAGDVDSRDAQRATWLVLTPSPPTESRVSPVYPDGK